MKFSIKDFFSKCDQIRRKLRIWSHLLKKSLMRNFIFCAVVYQKFINILKNAERLIVFIISKLSYNSKSMLPLRMKFKRFWFELAADKINFNKASM